jgi:outer membrane protein assembly factor BamB
LDSNCPERLQQFCRFRWASDYAGPAIGWRFSKEVCVALSVTNGLELWSTPIEDARYDAGSGPDDGPRTTPSIDAGAVYVLSSHLKLLRLNAANGAVVWSTNLLTGYGGTLITWQNGASLLLDSGLIF